MSAALQTLFVQGLHFLAADDFLQFFQFRCPQFFIGLCSSNLVAALCVDAFARGSIGLPGGMQSVKHHADVVSHDGQRSAPNTFLTMLLVAPTGFWRKDFSCSAIIR